MYIMPEITNIHIPQINNVDPKQLKIMMFVNNAIENGWSVKKRNNDYIFTKRHEGKKEVFDEYYLEHFLISHFENRA